jgi:hypothetical protein
MMTHYQTGRGTLCSLDNDASVRTPTADRSAVSCRHCLELMRINAEARKSRTAPVRVMTPQTSDTPITDAAMAGSRRGGHNMAHTLEDVARSLERSLAKANADREALIRALADFVLYVNPGDDKPLAAMLDEARATLAAVQS